MLRAQTGSSGKSERRFQKLLCKNCDCRESRSCTARFQLAQGLLFKLKAVWRSLAIPPKRLAKACLFAAQGEAMLQRSLTLSSQQARTAPSLLSPLSSRKRSAASNCLAHTQHLHKFGMAEEMNGCNKLEASFDELLRRRHDRLLAVSCSPLLCILAQPRV